MASEVNRRAARSVERTSGSILEAAGADGGADDDAHREGLRAVGLAKRWALTLTGRVSDAEIAVRRPLA